MDDAIKYINRLVKELQADGRLPTLDDVTKVDALVTPWIKRGEIFRIHSSFTANSRPLWLLNPHDWEEHERRFRSELGEAHSRTTSSEVILALLAANLEQQYQERSPGG